MGAETALLADALEVFGATVLETHPRRLALPLVPTSRPVLRPYQREAVDSLEAATAAGENPLLVAPTGSGKTVILAALIERLVAAGAKVLFLAPRRELVTQTSAKLDDVGVDHGVLLAGADERAGLAAAVQVASVETLVARVRKRRTLTLARFNVVIVDEAHLSITKIRTELVRELGVSIVGATATPTRKDGKALGALYDTIIEAATTASLTDAGHLAPARYFSWPTPDLRSVRTAGGDYNLHDLETVMNQEPLLGDIVQTWLQHGADRRTAVFATSIAHAVALAEAFRHVGVAAEHVDAGTPAQQRAQTFARFRAGRTQVLTNCFLAAYGFDLPALSCVVLARPTKSLMLYLQMLGRGLRIAPEKRHCLVLDHAGCVHRHGFATDPRAWTLDGVYALDPATTRAKAERPEHACPECHAVWSGSAECPECGYVLRPPRKLVKTIEGELVELGAGTPAEMQGRAVFYAELRAIAQRRGYRPGWAAVNFKERYGTWPPRAWSTDPDVMPSVATEGWVKSRLIAYAKAKARGVAA